MLSELERERLHALHALQLLDTPPEERFDRVVRLAQRLFDVPIAAVNLVDADRLFSKASTVPQVNTPRAGSFCTRTIESDDPFVVPDATRDAEFSTRPFVEGPPDLRFYAGAPLHGPGGYRVGTLCLIDLEARPFGEGQQALLRDLADWVERELVTYDELDRAGEVQRALLPSRIPDLPGYEVAGRCIPARQVGGDFFDWHDVDGTLQITLADVMGKGTGAAIIGAGLRALLRGASRFNGLGETVNRSARSVEDDLFDTSTFVTLWTGRLDPRTHTLSYVDAGHGLTSIVSADGTLRRLRSHGLPLGTLADDRWESFEDRLDVGDTLVLVSDGLVDLHPTLEAAGAALREACLRSTSAYDLVERMALFAQAAPPLDDVTVVVVRRTGR